MDAKVGIHCRINHHSGHHQTYRQNHSNFTLISGMRKLIQNLAMIPIIIAMIMRAAVEAQNCFGGVETFEKISMSDFDLTYTPAGTLLQQPDQALTRDCINLCRQQPACLSFGLDYLKFRCAAYNVNTVGRRDNIIFANSTNFFEKVCYKGVPKEEYHKVCGIERLWTFERVKDAFLEGFEESALSNIGSREECAKACLMETGFTCRSADYDYVNRVCRLSKEDRRTQPQAFRQLSGRNRDYIENQCAAPGPTTCVYNKKTDVGVITMDSLVFALNMEDCQQKCDKESTFNCRSFSIIDKRCFLSGDDTVSLANTALVPKPGSTYGEKNCVTEHCVHGIFTYEKITGYVMRSAVSTPIQPTESGKLGITMQCRESCDKAYLNCPAFTVNYQSSRCDRLDRNTQGRAGDLIPRDGENYFEKVCLRVPEIMSTCQDKYWAFERVIGHELSPVLYERVYNFVQSRRDCEEYCLQEKSFVCRSAVYNDETTECKLSREDRRSKPGNYVRNNNPKVNYLENQCIPSYSGCPMAETPNAYPTYTDLVESVGVTSRESCEKYCNDNRKFLCRSYAFYSSNSQCFISGDDHASAGASATQSRSGMSYHERKCDITPEGVTDHTPGVTLPDGTDNTVGGQTGSKTFPITTTAYPSGPTTASAPVTDINSVSPTSQIPASSSGLTATTHGAASTTNEQLTTLNYPSTNRELVSTGDVSLSSGGDTGETGTNTLTDRVPSVTNDLPHVTTSSTASPENTPDIPATDPGHGSTFPGHTSQWPSSTSHGQYPVTHTTSRPVIGSLKCGPNSKFTYERIPGFEPIGGFLMLLYSDTNNPGIVTECAKRCEAHSGCRAFVVDYSRRSCSGLFERSSIGLLDLRLSKGKDYFEGFCVPAHLACDKLWLYDRVLDQASVTAQPKSIVRFVHRADCRSRCLEEKRFQCLSVSYDATLRECRLYDQDRNTGTLHLLFTKGIDYMENQCASETENCRYLPIQRDITIITVTKSVRGTSTYFCETECNREKDFNCRSYTYIDHTTIPGANICLLSSDNQGSSQRGSMQFRPRALYAEKDCRGSRRGRGPTTLTPLPTLPTGTTTGFHGSTLFPSSTVQDTRKTCNYDEYTFEKTMGRDLRYARRERARLPPRLGIVTQCQAECVRRGARCQAFVIEYSTIQSCFLLEESANDRVRLLSKSTNTAYFEKMCIKESTCGKLWSFERVNGYTFEEPPEKILPAVESRYICEEHCIKIGCRSATYDYETKVCRLFTESRRSKPSAFKLTTREVDYIENHCFKEPKTCQYRDYPETFFVYIDRVNHAFSLQDCQRQCNEERLFSCRTVNFETYTRECALSSEDRITASIGNAALEPRRNSIYSERGICEQVSVQCDQQHMVLTLNFDSPFTGRVYAKGNPSQCFAIGTGHNYLQFPISLGTKCGTRQETPRNFANEVIIQQHPVIMTDNDRSIKVMCSFETVDQTVTLSSPTRDKPGIDVTSLMNARTSLEHPISSVVANTAAPPNVLMRILDKNGHDAQVVGLGDELTLKIELRHPQTAFAIFARNLYAKSANGESLHLIDGNGCPTDNAIFPALKLDPRDRKSISSTFKAFRFPSTGIVNFEVQIRFCQDLCEPARCSNGLESLGKRRKREINASLDDANVTLDGSKGKLQERKLLTAADNSTFFEFVVNQNRSALHQDHANYHASYGKSNENAEALPTAVPLQSDNFGLPPQNASHQLHVSSSHVSRGSKEDQINWKEPIPVYRSANTYNNNNPSTPYQYPYHNYYGHYYHHQGNQPHQQQSQPQPHPQPQQLHPLLSQYSPPMQSPGSSSHSSQIIHLSESKKANSFNPYLPAGQNVASGHQAQSTYGNQSPYNHWQTDYNNNFHTGSGGKNNFSSNQWHSKPEEISSHFSVVSTGTNSYSGHQNDLSKNVVASRVVSSSASPKRIKASEKKRFRPPRPLPRPKGYPVTPQVVSTGEKSGNPEVPLSLAIVVGEKDKKTNGLNHNNDKERWKLERTPKSKPSSPFSSLSSSSSSFTTTTSGYSGGTCSNGPAILYTALTVTLAYLGIFLVGYVYYKKYIQYSGRKLITPLDSSTENIVSTLPRHLHTNTHRPRSNSNVFFGPPSGGGRDSIGPSTSSATSTFRSLYSGPYGSPP